MRKGSKACKDRIALYLKAYSFRPRDFYPAQIALSRILRSKYLKLAFVILSTPRPDQHQPQNVFMRNKKPLGTSRPNLKITEPKDKGEHANRKKQRYMAHDAIPRTNKPFAKDYAKAHLPKPQSHFAHYIPCRYPETQRFSHTNKRTRICFSKGQHNHEPFFSFPCFFWRDSGAGPPSGDQKPVSWDKCSMNHEEYRGQVGTSVQLATRITVLNLASVPSTR
ncbi:hypothetical protein N431DRAFT_95014 [Stipitochalara longipes BDJ]|nr:hypothetical protein N431DRAFT_95014 [Stipitochalara longipes BDJ]